MDPKLVCRKRIHSHAIGRDPNYCHKLVRCDLCLAYWIQTVLLPEVDKYAVETYN